jgi:hypothetical protein
MTNRNVLIIVACIVFCVVGGVGAMVYFSPVQECIRTRVSLGADPTAAHTICTLPPQVDAAS